MPKNTPNKQQLNVQISSDLNEQILQCCTQQKQSKSDFMRSALQQKCDEILIRNSQKNIQKSLSEQQKVTDETPPKTDKIRSHMTPKKWVIVLILGVTIGTFLGNLLDNLMLYYLI